MRWSYRKLVAARPKVASPHRLEPLAHVTSAAPTILRATKQIKPTLIKKCVGNHRRWAESMCSNPIWSKFSPIRTAVCPCRSDMCLLALHWFLRARSWRTQMRPLPLSALHPCLLAFPSLQMSLPGKAISLVAWEHTDLLWSWAANPVLRPLLVSAHAILQPSVSLSWASKASRHDAHVPIVSWKPCVQLFLSVCLLFAFLLPNPLHPCRYFHYPIYDAMTVLDSNPGGLNESVWVHYWHQHVRGARKEMQKSSKPWIVRACISETWAWVRRYWILIATNVCRRNRITGMLSLQNIELFAFLLSTYSTYKCLSCGS